MKAHAIISFTLLGESTKVCHERRFWCAGTLLTACMILSACATTELAKDVPSDFKGETAWLEDHVYQESGSIGRVHALISIDGVNYDNAFRQTFKATSGRGLALTMVSAGRRVVAAKSQVFVLRASHVHAAPIQAMLSSASGTNLSVEKTYRLTLEPGKRYFVKGQLKAGDVDVWIEEAQTGRKLMSGS